MIHSEGFRGGVLAVAALALAGIASAQDLVITNGRIVDGMGGVIERGSVVVRDGRIIAVAAGRQSAPGVRTIDAGGRSVLPGFIDAHRHLIACDGADWLATRAQAQLQDFLDAGFTTLLSAIDPPQILEARARIARGEMRGPRLFAGAFVPLSAAPLGGGPGDPARTDPARSGPAEAAPALPSQATLDAVAAAARAGYDYLKTVLVVTPGGPEVETLKRVVAEGKKLGLPTITHAVSVRDTLAAVEAGPAMLVHTPHVGRLDENPEALRKIVAAGIPMTSTLAVFLPHFADDNTPMFRDGLPFPFDTLSSAGQGPVNARLLWEAGLVGFGYGTDTRWPPRESLADELRALQLTFSPADIVAILTRHAATATLKGEDFGTLEPGKLGDIVIVDGDPLKDVTALLRVVATVKEGVVVFERLTGEP